jgi:hypothetical protein
MSLYEEDRLTIWLDPNPSYDIHCENQLEKRDESCDFPRLHLVAKIEMRTIGKK